MCNYVFIPISGNTEGTSAKSETTDVSFQRLEELKQKKIEEFKKKVTHINKFFEFGNNDNSVQASSLINVSSTNFYNHDNQGHDTYNLCDDDIRSHNDIDSSGVHWEGSGARIGYIVTRYNIFKSYAFGESNVFSGQEKILQEILGFNGDGLKKITMGTLCTKWQELLNSGDYTKLYYQMESLFSSVQQQYSRGGNGEWESVFGEANAYLASLEILKAILGYLLLIRFI